MNRENQKMNSINTGQKRSRLKRNRIGNRDDDTAHGLIGGGEDDMEMDSMDEQKKNNRRSAANRLKQALNKTVKKKNPILFISNVMKNAQRWKNYATFRRKTQANGTQDGTDRRNTGGSGLTPEIGTGDDGVKRKDAVDGSADREMRNIQNRNLIEYFARLAHSEKPEECVKLEYVLSLLNNGADINCTDKYKQTVLHEAARVWDVDVARFLVECGANLDQGDYLGRTPLHVAAAVDYPEMVKFLIDQGANKEARTIGELQTPVHFASRNDAREALKILVKNGSEYKEVRDYKGRTPLHVAAELDRSETAKLLLELDDPAPAGVKDYSGQAAIVWMITKMPPVAKMALEQFHTTDRANRKQFFHLNWLEPKKPGEEEGKTDVHPQTAMQVLIFFRQYDLVTHPVISRLIDVKWKKFGKNFYLETLPLEDILNWKKCLFTLIQVAVAYQRYNLIIHPVFLRLFEVKWKQFARLRAVFQTIANFLFILLWTANGIFIDYQEKHIYDLPSQWWRIFLFNQHKPSQGLPQPVETTLKETIMAFLMAVWQMKEELSEYFASKKSHSDWKSWRENEIKRDVEYAHKQWPEESKYLDQEMEELDKIRPQYFNDFWNIFDWICYTLLLICVITHLVDVFQHTDFVARLHIRLLSITIILIWLRLLKNARAFSFLGAFIVIVSHMLRDVFKFFILYLAFFLPYSCAFWMIYGNTKIPEIYQGQPWASNYSVAVGGMSQPDELLFSLFRLTLVDEYAFEDMVSVDRVMTYFLVGTWLALSAVVMLNLLIALMSDTFQRVFDNANANAVMQKAITILSIEDGLSHNKKEKFRSYIHKNCAPEKDYYDDDATESSGEDLQKVTIQIKEQLDEFLETYYHDKTKKEKEEFDAMDGGTDGDDDDDDSPGSRKGGTLTREIFDEEIERIQEDMNDILENQNAMVEHFSNDMKKVMTMLEQIAVSNMAGHGNESTSSLPLYRGPAEKNIQNNFMIDFDGGARTFSSAARPPTGRVNYDPNLMQRAAIMDIPEPMSTFGSGGFVPRSQNALVLPPSLHSTQEWVATTQAQNPDTAWDDLDQKRKKDIKDLREKLAQQQKTAARHGKKTGKRRSRSVTSEDDRGRRRERSESRQDDDSVLTDSSVIPEIQTEGSEPQNPSV